MDTNKAAYWIALGVFALALNSEYRHGSFVPLHRVSEFAASALCRMAAHAEQTLAVARVVRGRQEFPADNLLSANSRAEMARAQGELLRDQVWDKAEFLRDEVRAQADVIRAEAQTQRAEIEQIHFANAVSVQAGAHGESRVTVICPKTGVRIAVNAGLGLADDSPDVEDSF